MVTNQQSGEYWFWSFTVIAFGTKINPGSVYCRSYSEAEKLLKLTWKSCAIFPNGKAK
jgi:hypothetical protein